MNGLRAMHVNNWRALLESNWDDLRSIILNHHPAICNQDFKPFVITAPNAEAACTTIREEIKQKGTFNVDQIYKDKDINKIHSTLSAAWFGVPEDRAYAVSLPGWSVLCDLLDDPPELELENN